MKRRTLEQEIRHLKIFLSDKISSINQIRRSDLRRDDKKLVY